MAPRPLPPLEDLDDHTIANFQQANSSLAYQRLLGLDAPDCRESKVLGYMLIYAPSPVGCAYMTSRINSCETDSEIIALGKYHIHYFLNYST